MKAFIAIKINPDKEIERLISKLEKFKELRTVRIENIHITLKFLGEITEQQAERISNTLEEARGFGKMKIIMKKVGCFPDEKKIRVIWVGAESDKLISLKKLIENKLEPEGFSKDKNAFIPHATIARAIENPSEKAVKLLEDKVFFEFDAGEIHLMKSRSSDKGQEYISVKKVKL